MSGEVESGVDVELWQSKNNNAMEGDQTEPKTTLSLHAEIRKSVLPDDARGVKWGLCSTKFIKG